MRKDIAKYLGRLTLLTLLIDYNFWKGLSHDTCYWCRSCILDRRVRSVKGILIIELHVGILVVQPNSCFQ